MNRNFVIAMAAALSITSAAGVGIGGYVMGHSNNKAVVSTTAMADSDAGISSITATSGKSAAAQLVSEKAQLIASNTSAKPATTAAYTTASAATTAAYSTQTSKPREFTVTPASYTVYCSIPALNVRTAPETEHGSVIGTVTQGQALQVTGEVNGYTWLQVNFNGRTAYVSSPYVQKAAPAAADSQPATTPSAPAQTPATDNQPATTPSAPTSDTTPSEESTGSYDIVSLDGWGLINTNFVAGMTAGEALDTLVSVKGQDADGQIREMEAVYHRLEKLMDNGNWMTLQDDEILETGGTYRSVVTVVAAERREKRVTFKQYLTLGTGLLDSAWNIERIECDDVTLHGNAHTV
ncbi:MAG: SH3 domain-containing protein [Lachnospiraceae bacterium]|nr:SH3 domain-containing protein [Lachnospiraceae bacterium]